MAESEKHSVRNGILIAVGSFIIIAILSTVWPFLRNVIGTISSTIGNHLISKLSVPWFVVWILVLLSLPTLWRFIKQFKRNKQIGPNLDDYTEDYFYKAVWRWQNLYNNFPDGSLWCYCPDCNTRLIYHSGYEHYEGELSKTTTFFCESCNKEVTKLVGEKDFALSTVARQIERKVNTGEWKNVVSKTK